MNKPIIEFHTDGNVAIQWPTGGDSPSLSVEDAIEALKNEKDRLNNAISDLDAAIHKLEKRP